MYLLCFNALRVSLRTKMGARRRCTTVRPSSRHGRGVTVVTYDAIHAREKMGLIATQHVPDEHMPSDFLTKWVKASKLRRCLAYVTNSRMRVQQTAA